MTSPRIDDPDRLAALRATELLDGSPGLAFERIARLARQLLGVTVALVSVLDDRRQVVLGHAGLDPVAGARVEVPLEESICRRVIDAGAPLAVTDLAALPGSVGSSAHTRGSYAGVPIVTADGHIPGVLCVADDRPREWTEQELAALRDLASSAAAEVELRSAHRRLAETDARYRGYVASSVEAIWRFEIDPPVDVTLPAAAQVEAMFRDARLAECNDVLARMYGYERATDIVGARVTDMMPATEARNVEYLMAFAESGYRLADVASVEHDREGRERHFINSLVGVVEHGHLVRAWGTQRDVSERRRVEAERVELLAQAEAARAEAERANRLKDEFLTTLSHELRTPLNAILGWAAMLRSGQVPEARREHALSTIERNAQAQARLIEDILDVSRIVSGKLVLDRATVDPTQVVQSAVDAVRPALEARNLTLEVACDPDLGTIIADAARLQQVLWNLLSNAAKFTPRGGRVAVRARRREGSLELEVSDSGQGIARDFLPHMFERFRQADASIARRHGGLGLGLAIVRHLVELHGGTVAAESDGPGLGATFIARLPVDGVSPTEVARPTPPDAVAVHEESVQPMFEPSLEGVHVLVVDDEVDARELLRSLLQACGAKVSTAADAATAYASLRADRPDVVVSDIGMPDEDGLSFMARVRQLDPPSGGATPSVALTAFARPEDKARALAAGFTAFLTKPVDLALLISTVADVRRAAVANAP